ncbi:MAG: dicarboxylate/amino acid:cation symporter [Deltaproteobacteria bacterium]|nr:dicarboxylate/amino acid:cation symporter [Deltaproteobacteria bacterium]
MILGAAFGLAGFEMSLVSQIAKILITLFRWAATPLVFFAILDAVLKFEIRMKGIQYLVLVTGLNLVAAITIALAVSNVFHAGRYLPLTSPSVTAETRPSFSSPQSTKLDQVMPIAIFSALALGLLGRRFRFKLNPVSEKGYSLCIKLIDKLVLLVPIAVFGAVGKAMGTHGLTVLSGLGSYFIVTVGGMGLHVLFIYHSWIVFYARMPLRQFWSVARSPALYAFGINSSLATLPETLKALDRLGVSRGASTLAACIGTNFNNDGILLYEVVAALFMAQAYGFHWSLTYQITVAAVCIIAMVGVGGVPEAGIISLSLVLTTVGLPFEGVPLLLGVDWFVARLRSVTNVLGDMTGSIAIDRFLKQDLRL